MNAFLSLVLTNAVFATLLFGAVAVCKSRIRNPAVLHLLWIMVLVKLLTPPLWTPEWALLPHATRAASPSTEMPESLSLQIESSEAADFDFPPYQPNRKVAEIDRGAFDRLPAGSPAAPDIQRWPHIDSLRIAMAIWATGALFLWGLSAWRIIRLQRCLRFASETPQDVQTAAASLAWKLGLQHCPQVSQVPGRVSPMLWAFVGPVRIILPSDLVRDLDEPSRRTLLLHELIHYRRGDHWVRWLELLSLGLYWWHPIAWLVRRQIREAEELACDATVVSVRPDDRRAYAQMLVNTVAFLSTADVPPLATGMGTKNNLEERLRMIMLSTVDIRLTNRLKLMICLLAVMLLPLAPVVVRAQPGSEKKAAGKNQPVKDPSIATDDAGQKTNNNDNAEAEQALVTVVDEKGKPVADVQVQAYLDGERVDRTFKTDQSGQFWIPRSWNSGDRFESNVELVVRKGDSHLGWLNIPESHWRQNANKTEQVPNDSLQIQLLSRTQTVRGTLIGPDGKPRGAVRAVVDWLTHPKNMSLNQQLIGADQVLSATTDQNGHFEIQLPADSQVRLVPDHLDWQRTPIMTTPETGELGQITLARGGHIQGQVVDQATGKPLVGQRVFTQSQDTSQMEEGFVGFGSAVTDARGHFVISGLSPGRFNVLFGFGRQKDAKQPALTAPAVEGVDVSADAPAQADFRAGAGRRLSGQVIDAESEEPIAKISVGYYGAARPNSGAACLMVQTDAQGRFEFHVPPGASRIYLADGQRQPTSDSNRTLEVPPEADLVDIVLKAGPRQQLGYTSKVVDVEKSSKLRLGFRGHEDQNKLHVKLELPAGKKANRVNARVVNKGSQHTSMWINLSSTNYTIPFNGRDDGRAMFLLIDADGFATARSKEFVFQEKMPELEVKLQPEVRVPVRGRVIDQAGKPVPGARVRVARTIYAEEELFPSGPESKTASDGRFETKHVRVGDRVQIRIDQAGTGGAESDWLSIDNDQPIDLPDLKVGEPDKEIGGVVRDYEGFAVRDAKVIHLGTPKVETTTDLEGSFRLTGLPTGVVSLAVESRGFPRDILMAHSGRLDNELSVNRISAQDRIDYLQEVTVRTRDGAEPQNVRLFFCVNDGELLMTMSGVQNPYKIHFAGEARRFQGKQFVAIVSADGYARPKPVLVPNQKNPKPIFIDLQPAAAVTLRGRVVDDRGRPIVNAKIGLSTSLTATANDEPWQAFNFNEKLPLTDANGKFEITGVPQNSRVAVYVNKLGYSGAWSERVSTDSSEPIEWPDLRLSEATGEIAGRVMDAGDRPVSNAIVSVPDLGGPETATDAEGRFHLRHVPNRKVALWVRAERGEWSDDVTPNALDLKVKLRKEQ